MLKEISKRSLTTVEPEMKSFMFDVAERLYIALYKVWCVLAETKIAPPL